MISFSASAEGIEKEEITIPGNAHKKVCVKGDPTRCVMRLEKGEKAPFEGILYTKRKAAEQAVMAAGVVPRVGLAKEEAEEIWAKRKDGLEKLHAVNLKEKDTEIELLKKAVTDTEPPLYERPVVVIPVTVAITLGVVALAIKGAQALQD